MGKTSLAVVALNHHLLTSYLRLFVACDSGMGEECIAAALMLHITKYGDGYFENMWAWVADHDLDDAENTMISVACGRGILIESAGPTW